MRAGWAAAALLLLAACSGAPKKSDPPPAPASVPAGAGKPTKPKVSPYAPAQEDPSKRGDYTAGGLYAPHVRDSVPDHVPDVDAIPEPEVVAEARSRYGNRSPYKVLGKSYRVLDDHSGFVETGIASYYGNKFHGRRTSNHEVYDMYAFTAAHKSLPLPSYARVTNLDNGRSVVVRVNDRGPFHDGRVVDLSYAAAVKLDIHRRGTGRVEVRALLPGDSAPARAATGASAIDGLVQSLPASAPASASRDPAVAVAVASAPARIADHPGYGREENRFRLVGEDGRVRSADEFDAWMRERQVRIDAASGAVVATAAPASTSTAPAGGKPPSTSPPVPPPVAAHVPLATIAGTTLQVAAFAAQANAERALARLHAAGVGAARLQPGVSAGKPVWRLQVGPVAAESVAELASRIAGLGFGEPRIVHE